MTRPDDDESNAVQWQQLYAPCVVQSALFTASHTGYGLAPIEERGWLVVLTLVNLDREREVWPVGVELQLATTFPSG